MVSLGLKGCRRLSIKATMTSSKMFVGSSSGLIRYFIKGSSELIYVYEDLVLHLWERFFVPCAVRTRNVERMRIKRKCLKTFFDDGSHVRRRGLYINQSSSHHQPTIDPPSTYHQPDINPTSTRYYKDLMLE